MLGLSSGAGYGSAAAGPGTVKWVSKWFFFGFCFGERPIMAKKVSTAGIPLKEQHGLVDCGPRRLEPEGELMEEARKQACPVRKNSKVYGRSTRRRK